MTGCDLELSKTFGASFMDGCGAGLWSVSMRQVIAFLKDERAATAIEYGLIATGIAVAIIPVLTGVGSKTKAVFTTLSTALK
jgi:pilus assembly protein Flp/PilA